MPPFTLEGNTLGEKHKNLNKLVQDALENNKHTNITKLNSEDDDLENLFKIDTANKTKNVKYIIEVLKCNDMLYVSRAIRHSTWLITEQEYEHIINPEYLHSELFPHMLTRAINKLLLHVRLHLKDEKRSETFYNYFINIGSDGNKWLLNCSIPFIESVIKNKRDISIQLYKRLCKRSVKFLPYYSKVDVYSESHTLKTVIFLLKSNTEEYLNVLDVTNKYSIPDIGKKYTKIIMKKCPNKILDNFESFISSIDLSMIAKHLKKEEIKQFLIKYMKNKKTKNYFDSFENLKHFINRMPREDRFEFVKETFIDKTNTELIYPPQNEDVKFNTSTEHDLPIWSVNTYLWYKYAPFDVAFVELKKLIRSEISPSGRYAILSTLIICARKNPQNIKVLLQYYYEKHRNEPFKFKMQFLNDVITQVATHEFDTATWNTLDKLFHTLEIYIESDNELQSCLRCIVLYKVLHGENVPDIVEKKLKFDTFKKIQRKLTEEKQNKLFTYLLNFISTKIKNKSITNETEFKNAISLTKDALQLLSDWEKDIKQYYFIYNKVQELLKIKRDNSYKTNNLISIYNIRKSYRIHMFEESVVLCPGEEVCLNILKHNPDLLTHNNDVIDTLRTNDTLSLQRLLAKLRVYWPHSLAQQWIDSYHKQMYNSTGHQAAIKGLIMLLPQNQLLDLAKKHAPEDSNITWNEVDEIKFSYQKNIAKNLYKARPLIPLDAVLWYAHGDYLQFTVPSLNAILHNMCKKQSRDYIPKLVNPPVSLQKFGLHFALLKLNYDELKPIFADIYKTTLNTTIRTHIFTHTYNLLCRVKDPRVAIELWELLSTFIDNLTTDDNKTIFSKLASAKKIHADVQGQFYMKSYKFFSSLPPTTNCVTHLNNLIDFAPNILEKLDEDFIIDKMLYPTKKILLKPKSEFIAIVSSYVLYGRTEEEQCERLRSILVPALEQAFLSWNIVKDNEYVCKENVDRLLQQVTRDMKKFLCLRKIVVPVKLFSEIENQLVEKLPIVENYIRYTSWVLSNEYIKLVADYKNIFCDPTLDGLEPTQFGCFLMPVEAERVWEALHIKISRKIGPIIVKLLKNDIEKYFPSIRQLFGYALNTFFNKLIFSDCVFKMETYKYIMVNEDFIPCYLLVCDQLPIYGNDEEKEIRLEIRKMLLAHPSLEVQMHYHRAFGNVDSIF